MKTYSQGVVAFGLTLVSAVTATLPLPTRQVAQFSVGTWIENLYVRSDGNILLTTLLPNASVYLVSHPASAHPDVSHVHTFGEVDGLLGITETEPNVFAVLAGNSSSPGQAISGTQSAWELDLRASTPLVRQIAAVPEAGFFNGVERLPGSPTTILISDSALGRVWRLDTRTGQYEIAIEDPTMVPVQDALLPIGINGIRLHQGYLYWTNTFRASIYRLRITEEGFRVPGAIVELVVHDTEVLGFDDLYFGPGDYDIIWTPTNLDNRLVAVNERANETATIVDGATDSLALAGGTACRFGRGPTDRKTLYVVTDGGLGSPVNGTLTEGGKLVGVDTTSFVTSKRRSLWSA
ncbi:hypothetical protein GQ53DRAFT_854614 [Thozetella sp. PMI_491]|nr:hypothetical protein GQ53DRAFT_854614 [Thozetella sp. PMI_491]